MSGYINTYSALLIKKIKQHLKSGGIIAYPTESCYGLGCDPHNYRAINKIIQLKRRSKTKGLIVISSTYKQLNKIIKPLDGDELKQLGKYWPGFYSLILPARDNIPPNLLGKNLQIAVRVSDFKLVQNLCNALEMPLVSTSANRSGYKSIRSYKECVGQFGDQVMVLPGQIGFVKKPSTIIDWATKVKLR